MKRGLVALCLVSALGVSAPAWAHDHHHHHDGASEPMSEMDQNRPAPLQGASVYQLGSKWKDENGAPLPLSKLRGKPVVAAMFYGSCTTACPLLIRDMQKIESGLQGKHREDTRFVLFSVDPKRDTPARLKEIAREHGLDLSHWILAQGDASSVRELAAVLGVRYKQDANGDFSHSNIITLLDREGVIQKQQAGLGGDPQEILKPLQTMP